MEIDAKNKILGRLASEISLVLQGKSKKLPLSEDLIIQNISEIEISGRKYSQKKYFKPSKQLGHLKVKTYKEIFEKNPAKILEKAVYNMLPKNKTRKERMKRLKIIPITRIYPNTPNKSN